MGTAKFETLMDFAKREVDVAIRCQGCRRVRKVKIEVLADVLSLGTRVVEAERRLRCGECGHRGARLAPILRLEP